MVDLSEVDSMFEEVARLIVHHQQGSASLIQRKFKLGYNRAGRLIDQLEAAGVVGPFEDSKAREVLIKSELELDELFFHLKNKHGSTNFSSKEQKVSYNSEQPDASYFESQHIESILEKKEGFIRNFIRSIFNI